MLQTKTSRIDLEEYGRLFAGFDYGSVFVSKDYLSCLNEIKNIEVFAIYERDKPIAIFPLNVIKRGFVRIFLNPPFTPYFNLLFENLSDKEHKRFKYLEIIVKNYMNFLKRRFIYFSVSQSPDIKDVRHFIWNGASVSIKYTYILENTKESLDSVDRMVKNKKIMEITEEYDFERKYRMLKEAYKNKPPISLKNYLIFMNSLKERRMIKSFSNKTASVTFLIDKAGKTVYAYNISGRDTGLLIYSVMKQNLLGDYPVDFLGANTRRISQYKSLFNPEIKSYFNIAGFYGLFH